MLTVAHTRPAAVRVQKRSDGVVDSRDAITGGGINTEKVHDKQQRLNAARIGKGSAVRSTKRHKEEEAEHGNIDARRGAVSAENEATDTAVAQHDTRQR